LHHDNTATPAGRPSAVGSCSDDPDESGQVVLIVAARLQSAARTPPLQPSISSY